MNESALHVRSKATAPGGAETLCWYAFATGESAQETSARNFLAGRHQTGSKLSESLDQITDCQIKWLRDWCLGTLQKSVVHRVAEGSEHIVYWDSSTNDVIKLTRVGCYGDIYYLDSAGQVNQRNCTPLEYLTRLELWDLYFPGFSLTPLGITDDGQIITRQPFIHGTEPTQEAIDIYLESVGWVPVKKRCWLWNYSHSLSGICIWLGDARKDNFVLQDGVIAPIDIRLWESDPEVLLKQQILSLVQRVPYASRGFGQDVETP
ncbi:MAG: hypothetical protein ACAI35_05470 [Candidatus Methylacidiphilales bacterium]|nr:hypothetical protein [Candidatus Methylacidiphilales bacterium]